MDPDGFQEFVQNAMQKRQKWLLNKRGLTAKVDKNIADAIACSKSVSSRCSYNSLCLCSLKRSIPLHAEHPKERSGEQRRRWFKSEESIKTWLMTWGRKLRSSKILYKNNLRNWRLVIKKLKSWESCLMMGSSIMKEICFNA